MASITVNIQGMRILIGSLLIVLLAASIAYGQDYSHLSTFVFKDGEIKRMPCPQWDWNLVPPECRQAAMNCLPRCGKYPGDRTDIGAMEWFPGITDEKPWGDWNGVPLTGNQPPQAPESSQILSIE